MDSIDFQVAADNYWRRYSDLCEARGDLSRVNSDALDDVEELCRIPGVAADVIALLLVGATTTDRLAYLAAGPIEDVIRRAREVDLAALRDLARANPRFRKALDLTNFASASIPGQWVREITAGGLPG